MRVGDINFKPLVEARISERRITSNREEYITLMGKKTRILPYKSEITVNGAETVAEFENGLPAIQLVNCENGKIYLSGISLGYCYNETDDAGIEDFIAKVMDECGIEKYKYADFKNGIYEKRLVANDRTIIFIFNSSDKDTCASLDGDVLAFGADAIIENNKMTVKSGEIGYAVIKDERAI
jgi:hypothetical protein